MPQSSSNGRVELSWQLACGVAAVFGRLWPKIFNRLRFCFGFSWSGLAHFCGLGFNVIVVKFGCLRSTGV